LAVRKKSIEIIVLNIPGQTVGGEFLFTSKISILKPASFRQHLNGSTQGDGPLCEMSILGAVKSPPAHWFCSITSQESWRARA
jgi:hypothetical protein